MDKEEIIEALGSWNFWKRDHETGVRREAYLERMRKLAKTEQVVAITGVRRSGKSTLMRQFIKMRIEAGEDRSNFLYVNFEEPRFAGMLSLEFLQRIYEAYLEIVKPRGKPYILLDEVQNVPKWERFVRGLHEKREAHLFVSGSVSRIFSVDLGTLLTGRWVEMATYPLGFREFLAFRGLEVGSKLDMLSQKTRIKQLLREYLEFGGFPLVVLKDEKEEILRRYLDDIIERDMAGRHRIRKTEKIKALVNYYLSNFSAHISYRKVAEFLGITLDTVERFSAYARDAHLVFFVQKFSYSLKEQSANPRMVYGIDAGLINIAGFRFMEGMGKLYENSVFLSLMMAKKEVYYYKNSGECDFLVKEGQKVVQAIQVSFKLNGNKERETRGLLEAMNTFGLENGLIITEEKEGEETAGNKKILYRPLWKWLLGF